ncbi:hypothetical protein DL766_000739 [Monosporascus sp. MC13-8B]|nr:hypothetical protein DL763_002576 [Monosporascus cannonballus]RYP38930.1 hypothetical protein DL766_000739 [Monosporascus sp. MC13-8B]
MSCESKRKASEPVEDGTKKVRTNGGNFENGDLQESLELEDAEYLGDILGDDELDDSESTSILGRRFVLNALGLAYNKTPWDRILLGLIQDVPMKISLEDFIHMQRRRRHPVFSKHMDEFLTSTSLDWPDHDPEVTARFNEFKSELSGLLGPEYDERLFCKLSGPASAVLGIMWYYPTMVTEKYCWGHTMDKTNPSMRVQYRKIGPNPSVLTSDRFPMRMSWSRSDKELDELAKQHPNWDRIDAACAKFQRELNASPPFIILVGGEVIASMKRLVEIGPNHEVVPVPLNLNTVSMFGKNPEIVVVRHRITQAIRQVVFMSYHGQAFYYGGDNQAVVAYQDLLWNAALQFADLAIKAEDSFSVLARGVMANRSKGRRNRTVVLAVFLRTQELKKEFTYPESIVRWILCTSFESDDLPPLNKTGSHVNRVMRMWAKNGQRYMPSHMVRLKLLAKFDALFGTKQGRRLLAKKARPPITFEDWCDQETDKDPGFGLLPMKSKREIWDGDHVPLSFLEYRLLALREEYLAPHDGYHICERIREAFDKHAVFYSSDTPGGLRWEGNGGPEDDDFDHDTEEHPAVNLDSVLTGSQKKIFRETGSFF